jgi:hypothetical protein
MKARLEVEREQVRSELAAEQQALERELRESRRKTQLAERELADREEQWAKGKAKWEEEVVRKKKELGEAQDAAKKAKQQVGEDF